MKKYKAGWFYFNKENEFDYYTDDFETFYKDNDEKLSNEDLEEWAVTINSPWSQVHETYEIKLNCKNAYTEMDENEPIWKCEYYVTGYDGISASVFGYGYTEVEALKDCKIHFRMLQNKYNPEDDSF
jgi:Sec7-like guanine-nucleotide exchange factor